MTWRKDNAAQNCMGTKERRDAAKKKEDKEKVLQRNNTAKTSM